MNFFYAELRTKEKVQRVAIGIAKIATLLLLLFLFVCSLDLLSSAFRLVGGRTTGKPEVEMTHTPRTLLIDLLFFFQAV